MDYKTRGGYHLNHDNLMILNKEDRQHMIFYFIANQVNEKLEPSDRDAYIQARQPYEQRKQFWTSAFSLGYLYSALKVNKNLQTKAIGAFFTPFVYYLAKNMTESNYENQFLSNDETCKELSKKYQFSVFDFAQAKKESHLKALKKNLTDGDNQLFRF